MATLLVNAGQAIVAGRLIGGASPAQAEPCNVGIGSGAGTTAAGDTSLFTEYTTGTWASYARTTTAGTRVTGTNTNDTYQVTGTFTAGASQTVTNAGCFDATSAGNMLVKGDFTGVALSSGDSIQITIKLRIA